MLKLKEVEKLPERKPKHDLQSMIREFSESNVQVVEFIFGEEDYKNLRSANSSLWNAIKRSGHPVTSAIVSGKIYMFKL